MSTKLNISISYYNRYSKKLLALIEKGQFQSLATDISELLFPFSSSSRDSMFCAIVDAAEDLVTYSYSVEDIKVNICIFLAMLPNEDMMELLDNIRTL